MSDLSQKKNYNARMRAETSRLCRLLEERTLSRIPSAEIFKPEIEQPNTVTVLVEGRNGEVMFNELARHGIKAGTLCVCRP